MARLQRTYHQLAKAQKKLEKYSKTEKQFQLQFVRQANKKNRFHTRIHIVRGDKNYRYQHKGLLHRLVNQKSRIIGDKPSFTKSLKAYRPKSVGGHAVKTVAGAVNFAVHDAVQTAVDVGLGAETVGMKLADDGAKTVKRKYIQKYRQEALDDYHKGTLLVAETAVDSVKGTYNHFKQKKQFKLEKARYRLKKAEYRIFKAEQLKDKLKSLNKQKKSNKFKLKKIKHNFKSFDKSKKVVTRQDKFSRNVRKLKYKKRSKQLKTAIKQDKNKISQIKSDKKFRKKELKKQWRIADLSRPAPLVFKPVSYTTKKMTASKWQKTINEDDSNDFLKVADEVKRHGVDKAVQEMNPHKLKEKNQQKKKKLEEKNGKKQQKLKKQEYRLKDKQSDLHDYKKHRNNKKQNMLADFLKQLKNMAQDDAKKFFLVILVPIIIILLLFLLVFALFSGGASSSGFILGTYASQDYDLSQSEKYYTLLAWDMNENVRLVGDSSTWKTGLSNFGVDTSGMKDTPDTFQWGKSTVYNWDPVYDFDVYKLWCFLCAYYYNFDAKVTEYWKYTSDTENLIKEIFDAEYEFVSNYDNTSHWEYRYHFDARGYYSIEGSGVSGSYGYIDIASPSATPVSWALNNKRLYFSLSNGEVLNYNDGYSATGWYLKDQYADEWDNSGTNFGKWYTHGETCGYGIWENGVLVTPNPYVIPECNWCSFLKKYDWKTDCRLYYSVKQKKTFDKVIEDKLKSMSKSDERLQYYKLLLGEDSGQMYGNHQTLRSIFGNTIHNYSVTNGFGYDMQNWNATHCKINTVHEGIDVILNQGSALYAPFDCKISSIDTSTHSVVLRKNDVEYWYDGSGGTKRDTEVYLSNVDLKSGLNVGDTLKMYDYFGNSTGNKNCDGSISDNNTSHYVHIKVKIDTDGAGWNYIDPRLVLY